MLFPSLLALAMSDPVERTGLDSLVFHPASVASGGLVYYCTAALATGYTENFGARTQAGSGIEVVAVLES